MLECDASARAIVATLCKRKGAGLGRDVVVVDVLEVGHVWSPVVVCGAVFSDILIKHAETTIRRLVTRILSIT